jgi:hypothetical protein
MIKLQLGKDFYSLSELMYPFIKANDLKYDQTFGNTIIWFDNLGQLKAFLELIE